MTLRIGLIGCGNWGRHILRDLLSLGIEVHVVAPSEGTRARALAGGASVAVERIEALAAPLDGYVVASPATTHAAAIEALLPTARAIFVEKPLTCDVVAARRLYAAAPERIFVMDKWRYHAGIEALAAKAQSGELGRILAVRTYRLGFGNPHQDVDPIWVLLPHDLSIALEILGHLPAPRAAFAVTRERADGDFIGVLADDDGPQVTMEIGVSHPVNRRSALVVGTRGSVQLGGSYDDAVMMVDGAPDGAHGAAIKRAISSDMPLLLELRAFVEHIRGGPPPRSSLADGLLIVERIAALRVLAGLKD